MTYEVISHKGLRKGLPRPEYRLFFLGVDDKVFGRLELAKPANDEAAIREARALRYPGIYELWDGTRRLVRRFEASANGGIGPKSGNRFWDQSDARAKDAIRTTIRSERPSLEIFGDAVARRWSKR